MTTQATDSLLGNLWQTLDPVGILNCIWEDTYPIYQEPRQAKLQATSLKDHHDTTLLGIWQDESNPMCIEIYLQFPSCCSETAVIY